jgi:hypothetical protein
MARAMQHTSTLDPTILTANILAEHPFPSAAAFGADWIAWLHHYTLLEDCPNLPFLRAKANTKLPTQPESHQI